MRKATNSPTFLVSKNAKKLERLMIINNLQNNVSFEYTIIASGGKWFAWYNTDKTLNKLEVVKHGSK